MFSPKAGALGTSAILVLFPVLVVPGGHAQGAPAAWSITASWNNGDGENVAYDAFNSVSCAGASECLRLA
jgi:hypothetical protein